MIVDYCPWYGSLLTTQPCDTQRSLFWSCLPARLHSRPSERWRAAARAGAALRRPTLAEARYFLSNCATRRGPQGLPRWAGCVHRALLLPKLAARLGPFWLPGVMGADRWGKESALSAGTAF